MKKNRPTSRLLSILLCLAMLFGVMPGASLTAAAEEVSCIHTAETMTELAASNALAAQTLASGGSYKLTGNVTLADTVVLTGGVSLHIDLNGYTLSGTGDLFLLQGEDAANKVQLTICDSSTGSKGKVDLKQTETAAITLMSNAVLDIYGGTFTGLEMSDTSKNVIVTKAATCTVNQYGGAISGNKVTSGPIVISNGTFNMSGGFITGNTATGAGGAIYVQGTSSAITMNGGEISGNIGNLGGAVALASGTLTVSGGSISGNKATGNGGAVWLSGNAVMTLEEGGSLNNNTASSGGGAVYCTNAKFVMTGGTVSGNVGNTGGAFCGENIHISGGTISGNKGTNGGVMWFLGNEDAEISGGTFIGNEATSNGSVFYSNGDVSIPTLLISGGTFTENTTPGAASIMVSGVNLVFTGGKVSGNVSTSGKASTVNYHNYQNTSTGLITGSAVVEDGGISCSDVNGVIAAPVVKVEKLTDGASIYAKKQLQVSANDLSIAQSSKAGLIHYTYDPEIFGEHYLTWTKIGGEVSSLNEGTYLLESDLTLTKTVTLSGDVSICLNNQKLTGKAAPYFIIPEGASLTICDCRRDKAGVVDGSGLGSVAVNGAFAQVTGGSFTLNSGTVQGFQTTGNGGVLYVNKGDVTFAGGTVRGNKAGYGGISRIEAGTVKITDGTFTENEGTNGSIFFLNGNSTTLSVTISGGTITNNLSNSGGVIHSNGAKITMTGGEFTGNKSNSAVFALQATDLTVSGGTISGNVYKNGLSAIRPAITLGTHYSTLVPCTAVFTGTAVIDDTGVRIDPRAGAETSTATIKELQEGARIFAISELTVPANDVTVQKSSGIGTNLLYQAKISAVTSSHANAQYLAGAVNGVTSGTFVLADDTILGSTQTLTGNMTLCLNGHTLSGTTAPYLKVGAGMTLTICDCSEAKSGTIDGSKLVNSAANGLLQVVGTSRDNGGTLNITGGTITGHKTTAHGAAIYMTHKSTLNMTGGKITGNETTKNGIIHFNANGTVRLSNCEITDNKSEAGIVLTYGIDTYIGEGVVITGNRSNSGGIVQNNIGKLTITGGTITGNLSKGATVMCADTDITMNAGEVFNNYNLSGAARTQMQLGAYSGSGESVGLFSGTAYVGSQGIVLATANDEATVQALEKGGLINSSAELTIGDDSVVKSGSWYLPAEDAVEDHEGANPMKGDISTITTGTYFLVDDVHLTTSISINGDVTICLNGYTITGVAAPYFNVIGGSLTVCDHSEDETGLIDGGCLENSNGSLIVARTGTSFTLKSGTIANHETATHGAAVYVINSDFYMEGGKITNNLTTKRGAICLDGATTRAFISGGEISYNTGSYGGAFYISGASLELSGGEIVGNYATNDGGFVYSNGGNITITGGRVYDNISTDYTIYNAGGSFTMSGGVIDGNYNDTGVLVGAVCLKYNGQYGPCVGRISNKAVIKDKGVDYSGEGTVCTIGDLDRKIAYVVAMVELTNEMDGTVYDEAEDPVTGFMVYTGYSDKAPHADWTELGGEEVLSQLSGGTYWLGNDLELAGTIVITETVQLCINGCEITGPEAPYFLVEEGGSLTICDHSKLGLGVMEGNGLNGNLVQVRGSFCLQGGGIRNADCAVKTEAGGTFTMEGGFVKACKNAVLTEGPVILAGGKISENDAAEAVVLGQNTAITISGTIFENNIAGSAIVEARGGSLTVTAGTFNGNQAETVLKAQQAEVAMTGGTVRGNGTYALIMADCSGKVSNSAVLEDLGVQLKDGATLTIDKLTSGASIYAPSELEGLTVAESDAILTTELGNGLTSYSYSYEKSKAHEGWKPISGTLTTLPAGSYYLTGNATTGNGVTITEDVELCLSGKTITGLKAPYFTIAAGGSLTICDHSVSNSGAIIGGELEYSVAYGLFRVEAGGAMTLQGGSIYGHTTKMSGGAIYSEGSFTMEGGRIHTSTADKGGAIAVVGTKEQPAQLTISGGTIDKNNDVTGGAAVYAKFADVTITGGLITENVSKTSRIVMCESVTFNMSGGRIEGNENTSGVPYKAVYLGKATGGSRSVGTIFGSAVIGDQGVQLYDTDIATVTQLEDDAYVIATTNTLIHDSNEILMTQDLKNGLYRYEKKYPFTNGVILSAEGAQIEDDALSLGSEWVRKSQQMTAQLEDGISVSGKKLVWYSSNASVATVSTSGKVTYRSLGTTVISVKVLDQNNQDTGYFGAVTITLGEEPLRVLAVGNPSTRDALMYLTDLARLTGNRIELGIAAPSSASIRDLSYYIATQKNVFSYYKTNPDTGAMTQISNKTATIDAILRDNEWDMVILQHGMYTLGYSGTYSQDVQYLIDFFTNEEPGVELYWNMGWAIEEKEAAQTEYFSQAAMYNAIVRCLDRYIVGEDSWYGAGFAGYAPTGTALQNLRGLVSYKVTRNGVDLSYEAGRLTAAMTMLKTLIPDADLDLITTSGLSKFLSEYDTAMGKFAPDNYENTADNLALVREAVEAALEDATTDDMLPDLVEQPEWIKNTEEGTITVAQALAPEKLHFCDVATMEDGTVFVPAYESVVHVMETGEGQMQDGSGRVYLWKSTDGGLTFDTENPVVTVDEMNVKNWDLMRSMFNMYKSIGGNVTKARAAYFTCDPRDPNIVTIYVDTDGDGVQEETLFFTFWMRYYNMVGSYANYLYGMQSTDGGETWTVPQVLEGVAVSGVKRGDVTWFHDNQIIVPVYNPRAAAFVMEWDVETQQWVALYDCKIPDTSPQETGGTLGEFNETSFIAPNHDDEVFAFVRISGAVLRSTDRGLTWEEVGNEPGQAQQPGFALLDEDHVFATWAIGTSPRDTKGKMYNLRANWQDTPSNIIYHSPIRNNQDSADPSCATLPDGRVYTVAYDVAYRSILGQIIDPWSEEYLAYEVNNTSTPLAVHEEELDGGVTLTEDALTVGESMNVPHTVQLKAVFTEEDQQVVISTRNGEVIVTPDSVSHGEEEADLALELDTEINIRVSMVGNDIHVRTWQEGEEEPTEWDVISSSEQEDVVTEISGDGAELIEAKIIRHVDFRMQETATTAAAGVATTIEYSAYPVDDQVVWTSSDPTVAVGENGVIYGKRAGTATITASIGDLSKSCEVTVVPSPNEINPDYQREILLFDDFDKYDTGRNTFWEYHWDHVSSSLYAFREQDKDSQIGSGTYRVRGVEDDHYLTLNGSTWFMTDEMFSGDYTAQFDFRFNQTAMYQYLYVTMWQHDELNTPYDVYCFVHMRYNANHIQYRPMSVKEENDTTKNPNLYGMGDKWNLAIDRVPVGEWGTVKYARVNGAMYMKMWPRGEQEPLNWDGVAEHPILSNMLPSHFRLQWNGNTSNPFDIDNLIISRATDQLVEHTHVYDQEVIADRFLAFEATEEAAAEYYYSCTCGEKGEETFFYGEPLPGDPDEPELPEIVPFEKFMSRMILGNALDLQFAFEKAEAEDWAGAYAVITKGDKEITVPSEDWELSGGYWIVTYSGICAREMNDDIIIQIFNAEDQALSVAHTDSVAGYVSRSITNANSKTKTLLVDMLNYGTEAQKYFGYRTDALANEGLTEEQLSYGTRDVELTDHREKGENYLGTRLVLENNISMQLAFRNVDESCYAVYSFTSHNGEERTVTVEGEDFIDGNIVEVDTIVLADARQMITCTVYNAENEEIASVTDSVESYVARTPGNDLSIAILKFATSAYNYFH